MLSVLIPTWNGRAHLESCLLALRAQTDPGEPWEILVHDNGSSDGTPEWLSRVHPAVRVLRSQRNLGFARAVNGLAEAARGEGLVLLNDDTSAAQVWLASLARAWRTAPSDVACVAGRLVDWEGSKLDFGGGVLTFDGHAFQTGRGASGAEVLFGCGANMLVRKDVFLALGGLDGSYESYLEDVDFGWRLWAAGWRAVYCDEAVARHRGSASLPWLGAYRRCTLVERNALFTSLKNFDQDFFPKLLPAVLLTFQSRLASLLGGNSWPVPNRWLRRLWQMLAPTRDPRTRAHLEAQRQALAALDGVMRERSRVQAQRRVSDREIFSRFPLYVVPTYPGDPELFASSGFRATLPADLPLRWSALEQLC